MLRVNVNRLTTHGLSILRIFSYFLLRENFLFAAKERKQLTQSKKARNLDMAVFAILCSNIKMKTEIVCIDCMEILACHSFSLLHY